MKFWDTSALVPLLVEEPSSPVIVELYSAESDVLVWWATVVEASSSLSRLEREGALTAADAHLAFDRLDRLAGGWHTIDATSSVRSTARRLLRVHPLRVADALQLAAAYEASEAQPSTLDLVTLDARLADAARREGFPVVMPGSR